VRVRFTPTARTQFLAALNYIRRDRPSAASRFRIRAERVLKRLERHPQWGVLPEFPELPYREVIVPPYRFFYRMKTRTVWIVGVWHGAQLPQRPDPGSAG
jgi:plasmid stabilization system protein ParE